MKLQKKTLICLGISLAIMLTALVLTLCGRGINFGLDFTGGLILNYDMGESFDTAIVEKTLGEIGVAEFAVSSSGEDGRVMQARIASLGSEDEVQLLQAALEEKLLAVYPGMDAAAATASYVGPVAGSTLVRNAISSVLLAAVLMLVYIAFRFDFASGLAAVLGLLHDVLIMLSFMVILRDLLQMNSSFIAAMLTIVGYSINNTIIIFDRIRENAKRPGFVQKPRMEIVETSVSTTLSRTINTTVTTLITLVALYVFGVESIREFGFPLIVGMLAGVYSSVLLSGQVWAIWSQKIMDKKEATQE